MTQTPVFFPLAGGMDIVTPHIARKPGRPIAALNYEPVAAGYRRLRGYERYHGGLPVHEARYAVLYFANGVTAFTGGLAASLTVIGYGVTSFGRWTGSGPFLTSGSYAAGTAAGYIVVTTYAPVNPADIIGLGLYSGATLVATVAGFVPEDTAVGSAADHVSWAAAAKDYRRSTITKPGGGTAEGPIRGIAFFEGGVLAVRDMLGGASGMFWKTTHEESGFGSWEQRPLNETMDFTGGGAGDLEEGMTITGATSGAVAVVHKLYLEGGAWPDLDAFGSVAIIRSSPGNFTAGETVNYTGGTFVATAAASVVGTIPAGGNYEFVTHNFYGASDLRRIYGVSGVAKAFEYDGELFVPIDTGMPVDTPNHIAVHANALLLSFPGGSVQHSEIGNPTAWSAVLGAGEIGIGSDVTGFITMTDATAVLSEHSVNVLYGTPLIDLALKTLSRDSGALAGTAQRVFNGIYLDDGGLRSLAATQQYGNFTMGSLSQLVAPLLEDFRRDDVSPVCSFTSRKKDQYWLFFDNQTGIVVYLGRKDPEILPFALDIQVTCCASDIIEGEERTFLGAEDGFVYEFDRGQNFDTATIEHYLRLPFYHGGSPRQNKRLHKITLEMATGGTTTLAASVDINNGSELGTDPEVLQVSEGGGAIDGLGSNELYYASQIASVGESYPQTEGVNFSLKLAGETSNEEPHTASGVTFHVSPRGLVR